MLDTTSHHENHDTSTTTVNSSERDFHDDETSTYWLPKDEEEQLRLTGVSSEYYKYNMSALLITIYSNISPSKTSIKGKLYQISYYNNY